MSVGEREWPAPALVDAVRFVVARVEPDRTVLVGVDGGAGPGKTTFTRWLAEEVRQAGAGVSIVLTASFYRPSAERANTRFPLAVVADVDWRRLREQALEPLRRGEAARYQLYDWPADSLSGWVTVGTGGVVVVDGVTSTRGELSAYYDLRV